MDQTHVWFYSSFQQQSSWFIVKQQKTCYNLNGDVLATMFAINEKLC